MANEVLEIAYPNHLREWIDRRGYSVQCVASRTDIPLRTMWNYIAERCIIPLDRREKLAQFLGCHMEQLVPDIEIGNDEMKRRELLYLFGVAGSALISPLQELDWGRLENALFRPTQLDGKGLQDLTAINTHYWRLYLMSSSKSSMQEGVLGQLKMLIQFLREPHTPSTHRSLCELVGDLSQLMGEIFFDKHEYAAAQSCYMFAASAAKEAEAYDLWSSALVRHAFIPIYSPESKYRDALPLLQSAQSLALRGDSALPTRYWVAAVQAEAASGIGDLRACQEALGRAQGVVEVKGSSPAWVRFDGSRLSALQGACYVRLGQPALAEPKLQEALNQFASPGRKRGMALTDLATAAIQRGDIEHACAYTNQVVDIIELGSSGFLCQGVRKLRQQLEPFSTTAIVSGLDRRMRLLA